MRVAGALLVVLAGSVAPGTPRYARAAPADSHDVNLLVWVPSVVAVSSTVANRAILPGHLVDGKLDTAWNSRTNELVGAWIAFRVPGDAHVSTIKLTVGFPKKDRKLGDLFTMNPRIKKVRVLRDGKELLEKALDPEQRGLQDIAVNAPGGDFKIEVVEIVPGTRKAWREISVSELEVWGAPARRAPRKIRPIVRVGSLDPPPNLSQAACVAAMFPRARGNRITADDDGDAITGFEAVGLGDFDICRIDHAADGQELTTVEIAVVKRSPRLTVVDRIELATAKAEDTEQGTGRETTLKLSPFPLTTTEAGLVVDATDRTWDMGGDGGSTATTLYRVTASGFLLLVDLKSTWSSGEASDSDRCTLQPPALRPTMPGLDVECVHTEGRWHHEDPRGDGEFQTTATDHYRWNGTTYDKT